MAALIDYITNLDSSKEQDSGKEQDSVKDFTSALRLIGSKQDYVTIHRDMVDSTTGGKFDCIECYDGHGADRCIDLIRRIPTGDIIQRFDKPEVEIQRLLTGATPAVPIRSGATCSIVKIYSNRVVCRSVGDSEIYVYINGEVAYHSTNHTYDSMAERTRLLTKGWPVASQRLNILSPVKMSYSPTHLFRYSEGFELAPTQSLGHQGKTGISAEVKTLLFDPSDRVDVIVATDGLWDVFMPSCPEDKEHILTYSAPQLAALGELRWKQEWEFIDSSKPGVVEMNRFGDYDDVGVAVYRLNV